jgi:uncharacterized protein (DUF305 family)
MNPRRILRIAAVLLGAAALVAFAGCGGGDDADDTAARGEEFDRAFIDAMVPHHESAIEMARAAKEAGLSQPDLVKVADDILATQQHEIDQMKEWRGEWFGSSTIDPDGGEGIGLSRTEMGMDMEHDVGMLRDSTDIDTDFAEMMIPHHQGAITMAELAKERAEHDELKELADAIIEAQKREIDVMRPHASGEHH